MAKMDLPGTTKRVGLAIERIKNQYLANDGNLPWLIGYSGGKDSTCTAQLVFRSLLELKSKGATLARRVVIFSSDTMIENPLVKTVIEKNIHLINQKAEEADIPLEAVILRPEINKTFWVNIIGRGYPCPNTMFRWCTDRLKIEPANNFVKKFIDKNGETIMLLGVRQGESQTRDRVLKQHGVEGEQLMRHTTLTNAYIFAPIIDLTTIDVFTYLSEFQSPWGSSNKELYWLYEESGGGECPIFLAQQDKTSKNSCGNSRLGCWVCTVVSQDKSLSGFIASGFHNHLKPLLNFRNWLAGIRDNDEYRCRFRANGTVYYINVQTKTNPLNGNRVLVIPKKGDREQIEINLAGNTTIADDGTPYWIVKDGALADFMRIHRLKATSTELSRVIIYDEVTDTYSRLGTGPFTYEAKIEILDKLLSAEVEYNKGAQEKAILISDAEIAEIMKIWSKLGEEIAPINEVLTKHGRSPITLLRDDFDYINENYSADMRTMARKNKLELDVLNRLLQIEKLHNCDEDRSEAVKEITGLFVSDRMNL